MFTTSLRTFPTRGTQENKIFDEHLENTFHIAITCIKCDIDELKVSKKKQASPVFSLKICTFFSIDINISF